MMTSFEQKQQREIEAAWAMHTLLLHDAAFDALAALLTILLGIFSFIHAAVRIVYGLVGMLVWTLGVWLIFLQWARAYCIQKSSTSPYRKEVNQDE